jgi:hypothetical protein
MGDSKGHGAPSTTNNQSSQGPNSSRVEGRMKGQLWQRTKARNEIKGEFAVERGNLESKKNKKTYVKIVMVHRTLALEVLPVVLGLVQLWFLGGSCRKIAASNLSADRSGQCIRNQRHGPSAPLSPPTTATSVILLRMFLPLVRRITVDATTQRPTDGSQKGHCHCDIEYLMRDSLNMTSAIHNPPSLF